MHSAQWISSRVASIARFQSDTLSKIKGIPDTMRLACMASRRIAAPLGEAAQCFCGRAVSLRAKIRVARRTRGGVAGTTSSVSQNSLIFALKNRSAEFLICATLCGQEGRLWKSGFSDSTMGPPSWA